MSVQRYVALSFPLVEDVLRDKNHTQVVVVTAFGEQINDCPSGRRLAHQIIDNHQFRSSIAGLVDTLRSSFAELDTPPQISVAHPVGPLSSDVKGCFQRLSMIHIVDFCVDSSVSYYHLYRGACVRGGAPARCSATTLSAFYPRLVSVIAPAGALPMSSNTARTP